MSENSNFFHFEFALVCRNIPASLVNGLSLIEHDQVDLIAAKEQHHEYLRLLEESGVKLIEIEANEAYPDCVFVEDTAVAIGNKIFLTNPGAESRRGEVTAVLNKFQQYANELNLEIVALHNKEEAFIDGGDVCFTGREILVGLSHRTNLKGRLFIKKIILSE